MMIINIMVIRHPHDKHFYRIVSIETGSIAFRRLQARSYISGGSILLFPGFASIRAVLPLLW